jgi:hypothetical protein
VCTATAEVKDLIRTYIGEDSTLSLDKLFESLVEATEGIIDGVFDDAWTSVDEMLEAILTPIVADVDHESDDGGGSIDMAAVRERHLAPIRRFFKLERREASLKITLASRRSSDYLKYCEKVVQKMLEYFQDELELEGFLEDGWDAKAVFEMWKNVRTHGKQLRERFCSNSVNALQILPDHVRHFANAIFARELKRDVSQGGRATDSSLSLRSNTLARELSQAGSFWRQLEVKAKWEWTDNIHTAGTGTPMLSDEIIELKKSAMRWEVKNAPQKVCPHQATLILTERSPGQPAVINPH